MSKSTDGYDGPRILILDIETAPIKAFVWRIWKENVGLNQIEHDWYVLCWMAKWIDSEDIYYDYLPSHKSHYKKNPENDEKILCGMWDLLDKADIVVTHNGDNFDLVKLNSRFLVLGFDPPSPYKSVDTLKIVKNKFGFTSNKLQHIATSLGIGEKVKHDGFDLWVRCLRGEKEAWKEMLIYNEQDVILLEEVYKKLRPWARNHPNFGIYVDDDAPVCPRCGSENLIRNGYAYTTVSKFRRYLCNECGYYPRGRYSVLDKLQKKNLLTNTI